MHPKFSGSGGNWQVIDEVVDPQVVQQKSDLSCGIACGEMLMKSRGINNINQTVIEELTTIPTWPELLANALNELHPDSKGRWVGNFVSTASFEGLNATGSWAAVLWEVGARIGHMVIVDSLDKNILTILDPWDGTKYKMAQDIFLQHWNGQAVYWIEK